MQTIKSLEICSLAVSKLCSWCLGQACWGGGGHSKHRGCFGRFVGKTRVKQKNLLKEHVRSVNL